MVPASRITPPDLPVAIVTGTTASGKTAASLEFIRSFEPGSIEVINADSLLVYRGFDIGTAKPSLEERQEIRHHLIDIRDPDQTFTAGDFIRECEQALKDIHSRGKRALIVGGTGFYLKALLFGLWEAPKADAALRKKLESDTDKTLFQKLLEKDPKAALRISPGDRYRLIRSLEMIEISGKTPSEFESESLKRPPTPGLRLFILDRPSDELKMRIAVRAQAMIDAGFLNEVESLRSTYPGVKPLTSVGYAEAVRFMDGIRPEGRKIQAGLSGFKAELILATTQLAKRQRTFFGNAERGQFSRASDLKFITLDREREELFTNLHAIYE